MHPLRNLFGRTTLSWEESDVKYYIQQYLQRRLKTDALYCEHVRGGVATIRVASPAVQQELTILMTEVLHDVAQATTYPLTQLRIYIGR